MGRVAAALRALAAPLIVCSFSLLPVLLAGCRDRAPPVDPAPQAELRAAPRPPTVVGTFVLHDPERSWRRLRPRMFARLPADPRVLLSLVFDVRGAVTQHLDLDAPALGALVADGAGSRLVVAGRVDRPAELSARLTTGQGAPYRLVPSGSVLGLVPREADRGPLAIAGGYLIVASLLDDAITVGAYLATTVSEAQASGVAQADLTAEVSGERLGPVLVAAARARWAETRSWLSDAARTSRASHDDRPADLADPERVLALGDAAVAAAARALGDVVRLRLDATIGSRGATLRVTPEFEGDSPTARLVTAMPTAHEPPWAPAGALAAAFVAAGGSSLTQWLASVAIDVLDDRLSGEEQTRLTALGVRAGALLGGPVSASMVRAGDGALGVVVAASQPPVGAIEDLVEALSGALRFRAIAEPLEAARGRTPKVVWEPEGTEAAGQLRLEPRGRDVAVRRKWPGASGGAAPEADDSLRVAWTTRDGVGYWFAGTLDARTRLADVASDQGRFAASLDGADERSPAPLVAAVALRLAGDASAEGDGWASLSLRRDGERATLHVNVEDRALSALLPAAARD